MEGDLSHDDVERYLRVNRRGKGVFAVIAGGAAVLGFVVGLAMETPDEHRHRNRRRDHSGALFLGALCGAVGLAVAVGVDHVRRRAQLDLTGDQIRRLDAALIANADVETELSPALIERTLRRANHS